MTMLRPVPSHRSEVDQTVLENIATWQSQIDHLEGMKARAAKKVLRQLADGARIQPGPRDAVVELVEIAGVAYDVLKVDGRKCYIYAEGGLPDLLQAMAMRFPG